MGVVIGGEKLYIKEVINQASFGGTKPVFIRASDEKEYLLKFRMTDYGMDVANFCEYIGYFLDSELEYGVSPQNIKILHIDDIGMDILHSAYSSGRIDMDAMTYAHDSMGPNLAVEKIPNVVKADNITNMSFSKKVKHIDSLILNKDRYKENPNILRKIDGTQLFAIDYGMGMLESRVFESLEDGKYESYAMALRQCDVTKDDRYLFKDAGKMRKVVPADIHAIISKAIDSMPREWLSIKHKDEIADLISTRAVGDLSKNGPCPFELF